MGNRTPQDDGPHKPDQSGSPSSGSGCGDLHRNRGPLVLLGYLISHESHHRGSMMLALKQNGFALSEALRWRIWSKWFSG